jgi:hypothetical protein
MDQRQNAGAGRLRRDAEPRRVRSPSVGQRVPTVLLGLGFPRGMELSMGMGVGLSGLLLAVPTVLAVLRGGRGRRHRRDDRHRPGPGADGGAALLLRAGILRAAVLLRATLSPPATRCPPRPATAPPQLRSCALRHRHQGRHQLAGERPYLWKVRFAPDSSLEGDGFEISVPGRETVKPSWEADCSRSGSGSVGEPKVRIRFPPAAAGNPGALRHAQRPDLDAQCASLGA